MVDGESKLAIDCQDFRSACIQLLRERMLKLVSTKQLLIESTILIPQGQIPVVSRIANSSRDTQRQNCEQAIVE